MRIISGTKKGKKLLLPDQEITRPLKDNVKENIFNVLAHSQKFKLNLYNTKVLDFFSGSGSFGIECISRGSKNVMFFEINSNISNTLFRNLSNNFDKKKYELVTKDFFKIDVNYLAKSYGPDIIFFDPPYKIQNFDEILNTINLLTHFPNLTIILHVEKIKIINFENFRFIDERIYGLSKIFFLKTNP